MTEAQLDLAHKLVGDIGHCVRAMEQYGNGRIADTMRNAGSLLQAMIDEYELVKAQEAVAKLAERRQENPSP